MKNKKEIYVHSVVEKLRKMMTDKNITQAAMAEYAETSPSQFSKILNGQLQLSLSHISNIARNMKIKELDIFTYPDVYVKKDGKTEVEQEPIEATLQIKLKREKKDQVLKLVFGENNLEILNK